MPGQPSFGCRLNVMKLLGGAMLASFLLVLAACGGGEDDSSGSVVAAAVPVPATSAAEVDRLIEALREDDAQAAEDAQVRNECGDVTPIKDYNDECAEPWADKIVVRLAALEAVVNELKGEVGAGCRKALEGGNPYNPLDARKISRCSQDVGSAP